MKKWIFFIPFFLSFYLGKSQVIISLLFGDKLNTEKLVFGLSVSPTLSNITQYQANYRFGLGLALYFTLQLNDRFYFQLEAIPKSPYGAKNIKPYPVGDSSIDNIFKNGSVERKIKTISLPLLIRYRIGGLWFIETGPQIDWMLGGKDIFTVKSGDNELSNTIKVDDDITKFDIGWAGGLVYKFKKDVSMAVGIRYFYGLTDIIKSTPGNQHNSAWLMSVYIPIGAGKAAARRQKELEEKNKQ